MTEIFVFGSNSEFEGKVKFAAQHYGQSTEGISSTAVHMPFLQRFENQHTPLHEIKKYINFILFQRESNLSSNKGRMWISRIQR
jgi:hypothetical protein